MLKKLLMFSVILAFIFSGVFALSADRSFSDNSVSSSELIMVSIDVDGTGASLYGVDDYVPDGWTVDIGSINEAGSWDSVNRKVSWLFMDNANRVLSYQITASSNVGTYNFNGEYSDGINTYAISGDTQVQVVSILTPQIKINEFELDVEGTDDSLEWVELYNYGSTNVDISGWKIYDVNGSTAGLRATIPASTTINSYGYYVVNGITSLNNAGESIILKDSSDNLIDQTPEKVDSDNDNKTWQRIPDGSNLWDFVEMTKGTINEISSPVIPSSSSDDYMVNYVRGKVVINGIPAGPGVEYLVEVLDGVNVGSNFTGLIDDNTVLPNSLLGNGFFDTRDQVVFRTGDRFRVSVDGYDNCSYEGQFVNGGNGWFEPEQNLAILNCIELLPATAPVLNNIGSQIVLEGELLEFNVSATDVNSGDVLTYSATNLPSGASFVNNVFRWTPDYTQSGVYSIIFNVSDSTGLSDSENVSVTVGNVNQVPSLTYITPIFVNEGQTVEIIAKANDIDGDVLVYNIDNSNFVDNTGGNFTWQTNYTCDGFYQVNVSVSDGVLIDSQIVYITVYDSNVPPLLDPIADVNINEDSGISYFDGYVSASDVDGTIVNYYVMYMNSSEVECSVNRSGDVLVKPANNWNGIANCSIVAVDDDNALSNPEFFDIIVTGTNDAPIVSGSPSSPLKLLVGTVKNFLASVYDIDGDTLFSYEWFLNSNPDAGQITGSYSNNFSQSGNYNLTVMVNDGTDSGSYSWNILVGGKEIFTCNELGSYRCGTGEYCTGENWTGLDGQCCSVSCSRLPLVFEDVKQCNSPSADLRLKIKDPDKGDEFFPNDDIDVELDLENNYVDDKDFKVWVYLYDYDEQEDIDQQKESVDVDERDTETIETTLVVPDKVDEKNDHYVYVYVEDEDDENICTSGYVPIDISREDDDVIIQDFSLDLARATCRDPLTARINVKNIGSDDQDVYVTLQSSELGLDLKSEEFELEKYDKDDEREVLFYFKIPAEVKAGDYDLVANVFFSGEKRSETSLLNVGECKITKTSEEPIDLTPTSVEVLSFPKVYRKSWWDRFVDWLGGRTYFGDKNKQINTVYVEEEPEPTPVVEKEIVYVQKEPDRVYLVDTAPKNINIDNNVNVNVDVNVQDGQKVEKKVVVYDAPVIKEKTKSNFPACFKEGECFTKSGFYLILDILLGIGIIVFFILLIVRLARR